MSAKILNSAFLVRHFRPNRLHRAVVPRQPDEVFFVVGPLNENSVVNFRVSELDRRLGNAFLLPRDRDVDVVTIRVVAAGRFAEANQREEEIRHGIRSVNEPEFRDVLFADGWTRTEIRNRIDLEPEVELSGPLIVEEPSSATVIKPGYKAIVEKHGLMMITRQDNAG